MRWSPRDNLLPHPPFVLLLLVAAVVAAYYPAVGSGLHTVDDPGIVSLYSSSLPLFELLQPGHGGYYYRPVVELSYYLDGKLWSMEPAVLHLENVLLHIGNAFLVYLLAAKVAKRCTHAAHWVPLCVALLFALHPLNVEAVAWISGRPDLLATLFILGSALFLLSWLERARWRDALCAAALFGLGVLAKETAVAFLPVALLFLLNSPSLPVRSKPAAQVLVALSLAVLVVSAGLFFREELLSLKRFLAPDQVGLFEWSRNSATAFGFYLKKMLFPFPLNFAIAEVHPGYALLGAVAPALLVVAFFLRRFQAQFFVASALMVLPSLLVATKRIAWTPFAERYLYLPSAFFAVGVACLLLSLPPRVLKASILPIVLLLCAGGFAVFHRSALWQDKLAFYRDAVQKSPRFGSVYNELGNQLVRKGDYQGAEQAFFAADLLNQRPSMDIPIKCNVMSTMIAQQKREEARAYFYRLFPDKQQAPADFLELLCKLDGGRLETLKGAEKAALQEDLLQTLALLYRKNPDPFWLYRSGQVARAAGRTKEAADHFARAYALAPADASYKAAAKTSQLRMEAAR